MSDGLNLDNVQKLMANKKDNIIIIVSERIYISRLIILYL